MGLRCKDQQAVESLLSPILIAFALCWFAIRDCRENLGCRFASVSHTSGIRAFRPSRLKMRLIIGDCCSCCCSSLITTFSLQPFLSTSYNWTYICFCYSGDWSWLWAGLYDRCRSDTGVYRTKSLFKLMFYLVTIFFSLIIKLLCSLK